MKTIYYTRIDGTPLATRDFVTMAQRLGYQVVEFNGFEHDGLSFRRNCRRTSHVLRALGMKTIEMSLGIGIHVHTMRGEICDGVAS